MSLVPNFKQIEKQKSPTVLRELLSMLDVEIEKLKELNLSKGNQWKSRAAKIQVLNLYRYQDAVKKRIGFLERTKAAIEIAKASEKAKIDTDKDKIIFTLLKVFARRENASAISQHRRNVIANERLPVDEIITAPPAPLPPVGRQDQELIELIKRIQVEKPHLNAGEAMIEAQAKISAEGLPTEDFLISELLSGKSIETTEIEQASPDSTEGRQN